MDINGKCVGTEDIGKINKLDLMERNKAVYLMVVMHFVQVHKQIGILITLSSYSGIT